jgi:Sec7-like guanine-nucleotide exchange factor
VTRLIKSYRDNFSSEISSFIENIFFRLLESSNANFSQRFYTIKVFINIFNIPRVVFEFFVNYDCALGEISLVE